MTRTRLLALALSLAIAPAAAADAPAVDQAAVKQKLEAAPTAMNAGDTAEAFRLVGVATEIAHSGAMAHKLGHLYEGAAAVPDHDALATKWFAYAAELDDAESLHHLGMRYIDGTGGVSPDFRKGLALVNRSANGGYDVAEDYMRKFNADQDTKGRCMLSTLRGYDMREVVFGANRFYDFSDTGGEDGGGDTYEIVGLRAYNDILPGDPRPVALTVDGFSHVGYTEVDGHHFYEAYYDKRRPSSAALQRAAQVRAKCGVPEA